MNGYFITILIFEVLAVGVTLAKHGEPRDGNYNFFARFVVAVITIFLTIMAIRKGF